MRTVWTMMALLLAGEALAGEAGAQRHALAEQAPADDAVALDGTLTAYVRHALATSPQVRAAYAGWDAEVRAIRGAGAPPEPTVGLGLFLSSVETRVGPQQAKLSLQQRLPWPTALLGRHDAAVARARLAQSRFDQVVLTVSAEVAQAYWTLWEVRATRTSHRAHLEVLDDLSQTLRARLEVGTATLADLQQVDLSNARLADALASLDARERRAEAWLRAAVGGTDAETLGATSEPVAASLPTQSLAALTELALAHPEVDGALAREEAAAAATRVAKSQRGPGLSLGADWIVTGPSATAGVADSGKDAVMVGVGIQVPLWQGAYAGTIGAAAAAETQLAHQREALELSVRQDVEDAWVRVEDGVRRVGVVQDTLLPQAEGTYTALLGSYAVGEATVAQVLLAQRDLLELQIQRDQQQAELERAWAVLEARCGQALSRETP